MQVCFPCSACNQSLVADSETQNPWVECPACHLMIPLPGDRSHVDFDWTATRASRVRQPILDVDLEELPDTNKSSGGSSPGAFLKSAKVAAISTPTAIVISPAAAGQSQPALAIGDGVVTVAAETPVLALQPGAQSLTLSEGVTAYRPEALAKEFSLAPGTEASITALPDAVKETFELAPEEIGLPFRVEKPPDVPPPLPMTFHNESLEDRRIRKQLENRGNLRHEAQALKITSLGLRLIYWSAFCFLLGVVFLVATTLSGTLMGGAPAAPGLAAITGIFGISLLVGLASQTLSGLLMFAGKLCCCWVPVKSQARPLILISLCMDLGALTQFALSVAMMTVVPIVVTAMPPETALTLAGIFYSVAMLMLITSFVLLFLFIKAFATYLEEPGIAADATSLLLAWLGLTVAWPLAVILMVMVGMLNPAAMLIVMVLIPLGSFLWFWLYLQQWFRLLNMIGALRQVLATVYGF